MFVVLLFVTCNLFGIIVQSKLILICSAVKFLNNVHNLNWKVFILSQAKFNLYNKLC